MSLTARAALPFLVITLLISLNPASLSYTNPVVLSHDLKVTHSMMLSWFLNGAPLAPQTGGIRLLYMHG